MIAHRLSTVAAADHIVVLDEGRVVEPGHHHALLAADDYHAELWAERLRATGWCISATPEQVSTSAGTSSGHWSVP
ncbi:MAG: hypothetical protein ACRDRU_23705 [Pseudonocardiaceae bacterium]